MNRRNFLKALAASSAAVLAEQLAHATSVNRVYSFPSKIEIFDPWDEAAFYKPQFGCDWFLPRPGSYLAVGDIASGPLPRVLLNFTQPLERCTLERAVQADSSVLLITRRPKTTWLHRGLVDPKAVCSQGLQIEEEVVAYNRKVNSRPIRFISVGSNNWVVGRTVRGDPIFSQKGIINGKP